MKNTDEQTGGFSGKVLVYLPGSITLAVCAEPAIRSLKSSLGSDKKIVLCGEGACLYQQHPDIAAVFENPQQAEPLGFEQRIPIGRHEDWLRSGLHPVAWVASQLSLELNDRWPQVHLHACDHVSLVRYQIASIPEPRIAIAASPDSSGCFWPLDQWRQLCSILMNTLSAGIVQLGHEKSESVETGTDLIGCLNPRQAAAVLSRCDAAVCFDNEFAHLAAAVGTPGVVLTAGDPENCIHDEAASLAVVPAGSWLEAQQTDANCPVNIELKDVVDGIVNLCGV